MSNFGLTGILETYDLLQLSASALRRLPWRSVERGAVTQDVVTYFLRLSDAFWRHDGDMSRPHVQLTSGMCSNGFVDVMRLLKNARVSMLFAREFAYKLTRAGFSGPFDWVIGSDHGSAAISHAVAVELGAQHDFTEKAVTGFMPTDKRQVWRRFRISPGETVLLCEEILTTTGTLRQVRDGIIEGNEDPVEFFPVILTVVNRSWQTTFEGSPIISLADYDMQTWERDRCPLCAAGSPRVRPKQNWNLLTGKA